MDSGGLCRVHGGRLRRGGGVGGGGGARGGGGGGGRSGSLCSWFPAPAGLHAVPQAPVGMARAGCAYGDRCTFAHSWAELHPEASAHEQQLASHLPG